MVNTNLLTPKLVSVIIPMYNSQRYIEATINSVLNQTYNLFEIIVIDDYSKDNSCKIVDSIQDSRIKLIKFSENKGVAIARNVGVENAKGQYICFLDSDDLWGADKLLLQINEMSKGVFFSYTAIGVIDEKGNCIKSHVQIPEICNYKLLQKNTVIATSTVMLDRFSINNFKMPNMRSGQDYATWMLILSKGIIAYGINQPLVLYRKRNNSLSSGKLKSIKQVWNVQRKQQKINVVIVVFNVSHFILYGLKKHLRPTIKQ